MSTVEYLMLWNKFGYDAYIPLAKCHDSEDAEFP